MTMELIPAIDLLDGSAVRLVEGDYAQRIRRTADAIELAAEWARAGARRLHVVDLDGARAGRPMQLALAARVARAARIAGSEPVTIELGGGLRTTDDIGAAFAAGIDVAILGTAAIESPTLVAHAAARWPGRISASLDLRDAHPALDGWTRTIEADPIAVARRLLEDGAARLILTDAARDGTLGGPNLPLYERFRAAFPDATLVAAGGVGGVADLEALARIGLGGAIVGRALLDGSLSIGEALEVAG
jgi:phosphoribosylformimino-5-aminoimidazole carboxamide ribotide isomerase